MLILTTAISYESPQLLYVVVSSAKNYLSTSGREIFSFPSIASEVVISGTGFKKKTSCMRAARKNT